VQNRISYLTVDIASNSSLGSCNWETGTCEFDTSAIRFCVNSSLLAAVGGCP
jgi:hypothetical protein